VFLYMILKGSWPGLSVFIHEIKWMLISTVLNRRSIKYIFGAKMCNFGDIWGSVYLKICINDLKQKDLKYLGTVTSICDCIWNDMFYGIHFWSEHIKFLTDHIWILSADHLNFYRTISEYHQIISEFTFCSTTYIIWRKQKIFFY
jgi:hypothetical protein